MKFTGHTIALVVAEAENAGDCIATRDGSALSRILEMIKQAQTCEELVDVRVIRTVELGSVRLEGDQWQIAVNGDARPITLGEQIDWPGSPDTLEAEVIPPPPVPDATGNSSPVGDNDIPF